MRCWLLMMLLGSSSYAVDVRLLVSIGNNVGSPTDAPLEHAERDAERIAELFTDIGEVSASHVVVATGRSSTEVRERLVETIGRVKELSSHGDTVSLVVFVSAHASDGALHLKGTSFPLAELRQLVEGSGASFKLVLVDACESGAIIRTKGARPVPEFDVSLESQGVKGSVYVSSSGPAEASQEVPSLSGSLFTHHLLTGLRGDADVDGDGQVSLTEVYTYAFRRTVAGAERLSQHPTFDIDAAGVGDMILSRPRLARSSIRFPADAEGHYVVMSQGRPDVVAEVEKVKARTLRLAVPPGRYLVRKKLGALVGLVSFDLPFGGEKTIAEQELTMRHFTEVTAKGTSFESHPWSLLVEGGIESEQLVGMHLRARPALGGRFTHGALWARASFGVTGGEATYDQLTTTELQLSGRLALGYRFLSWPVVPTVGVVVDGRWLQQRYRRADEDFIVQVLGAPPAPTRWSSGVSAGPLVGLEVSIGECCFVAVEVSGLVRWLPAQSQPAVTLGIDARALAGLRL